VQNPHKTIAAYAKDLDIVVFNGHVHTTQLYQVEGVKYLVGATVLGVFNSACRYTQSGRGVVLEDTKQTRIPCSRSNAGFDLFRNHPVATSAERVVS
jgi:hypothetical protein